MSEKNTQLLLFFLLLVVSPLHDGKFPTDQLSGYQYIAFGGFVVNLIIYPVSGLKKVFFHSRIMSGSLITLRKFPLSVVYSQISRKGAPPHSEAPTPEWLRFMKFACENVGVRAGGVPGAATDCAQLIHLSHSVSMDKNTLEDCPHVQCTCVQ